MRKWTIIDTLIVAAVVVVAIVGVKILGTTSGGGEKSKAEIVVLADSKETGFADAVKVGESITISLNEKDSGTVTKVESEPAKVLTFDSVNGVYHNSSVDAKEDVYIYIEADCSVNERAITVGETVVKVGEYTSVRGKGYATECHIVGVTVRGEDNE